jgi:hypothetical protein
MSVPIGSSGASIGAVSKESIMSKNFIPPAEVAARWAVSRQTATRVLREQGARELRLHEGRGASVRFALEDVLRIEQLLSLGSARTDRPATAGGTEP